MLKKRQASFRMSKTRQDKDVINDTQDVDTFARFSRTGDTASVGESDEAPMPARAASPQFLRDAREDQHSISKRHFETFKQKQEALPGMYPPVCWCLYIRIRPCVGLCMCTHAHLHICAFLCVRMQRSRVAEGFRL
jgi:hypothetical protein